MKQWTPTTTTKFRSSPAGIAYTRRLNKQNGCETVYSVQVDSADGARPVPEKRCTKCHTLKPERAFYKLSNGASGLQSWCAECQKTSNRAQYLRRKAAGLVTPRRKAQYLESKAGAA